MLSPLAPRIEYIWAQAHKLGYGSAIALVLKLAYNLLVFYAMVWMFSAIITEVILCCISLHVCIHVASQPETVGCLCPYRAGLPCCRT